MRLPHPAGSVALEESMVSRATPLPSGFIPYSSPMPSRELSNRIRELSGHHAGFRSTAGLSVSRVTPLPSAFMT